MERNQHNHLTIVLVTTGLRWAAQPGPVLQRSGLSLSQARRRQIDEVPARNRRKIRKDGDDRRACAAGPGSRLGDPATRSLGVRVSLTGRLSGFGVPPRPGNESQPEYSDGTSSWVGGPAARRVPSQVWRPPASAGNFKFKAGRLDSNLWP
jgi:hypothetical protein